MAWVDTDSQQSTSEFHPQPRQNNQTSQSSVIGPSSTWGFNHANEYKSHQQNKEQIHGHLKNAEKAFDKTLSMLRIVLKMIEAICEKPRANILNKGKLKASPLRSGATQGMPTSVIQCSTGSFSKSN